MNCLKSFLFALLFCLFVCNTASAQLPTAPGTYQTVDSTLQSHPIIVYLTSSFAGTLASLNGLSGNVSANIFQYSPPTNSYELRLSAYLDAKEYAEQRKAAFDQAYTAILAEIALVTGSPVPAQSELDLAKQKIDEASVILLDALGEMISMEYIIQYDALQAETEGGNTETETFVNLSATQLRIIANNDTILHFEKMPLVIFNKLNELQLLIQENLEEYEPIDGCVTINDLYTYIGVSEGALTLFRELIQDQPDAEPLIIMIDHLSEALGLTYDARINCGTGEIDLPAFCTFLNSVKTTINTAAGVPLLNSGIAIQFDAFVAGLTSMSGTFDDFYAQTCIAPNLPVYPPPVNLLFCNRVQEAIGQVQNAQQELQGIQELEEEQQQEHIGQVLAGMDGVITDLSINMPCSTGITQDVPMPDYCALVSFIIPVLNELIVELNQINTGAEATGIEAIDAASTAVENAKSELTATECGQITEPNQPSLCPLMRELVSDFEMAKQLVYEAEQTMEQTQQDQLDAVYVAFEGNIHSIQRDLPCYTSATVDIPAPQYCTAAAVALNTLNFAIGVLNGLNEGDEPTGTPLDVAITAIEEIKSGLPYGTPCGNIEEPETPDICSKVHTAMAAIAEIKLLLNEADTLLDSTQRLLLNDAYLVLDETIEVLDEELPCEEGLTIEIPVPDECALLTLVIPTINEGIRTLNLLHAEIDTTGVPEIDSAILALDSVKSILFNTACEQFVEPNLIRTAGNTNFNPQVLPVSPSAAQLAKFAEIPVSLYTGTPNISIPLYDIQINGFTLPVSLDYHASGIKVDQMASNVGLGWALNAGGVITRQKRGLTDILSGSRYAASTAAEFDAMRAGQADGEPDIFSFNFAGHSGQFFFDNGPQIISKEKLEITYTMVASEVTGFTIRDAQGVKYIFDRAEYSYYNGIYTWAQAAGNYYEDKEKVFAPYQISQTMSMFSQAISTSSWYLTKIEMPNSSDYIQLSYDWDPIQYYQPLELKYYTPLGTEDEYVTSKFCVSTILTLRLSSIAWKEGRITFGADFPRTDIPQYGVHHPSLGMKYVYPEPSPGHYAISTITISQGPTILKQYKLDYNYFTQYGAFIDTEDPLSHRLRLESVTELSASEALKKPPYTFDYEKNANISSLHYEGHDFWGYHNNSSPATHRGKPMLYQLNTTEPLQEHRKLAPFSALKPVYNTSVNDPLAQDRSPNETAILAGLLRTITYPDGHKTSFIFEPHFVVITPLSFKGGGIRIAAIFDHDPTLGRKINVRDYQYGAASIFTLPQLMKTWYRHPDQTDPGLQEPSYVWYGSSLTDINGALGPNIGYKTVTVNTNGNGKKVSEFHIPGAYGEPAGTGTDYCDEDSRFYTPMQTLRDGGKPAYGLTPDYYPYIPGPNIDWCRGHLLKETVYDKDNNMVSELINEYTIKGTHTTWGNRYAILNEEEAEQHLDPLYPIYSSTPPYRYGNYKIISAWKVLNKQTETRDGVTTVREFNYDGAHMQLSSQKETNSDGTIKRSKYVYPADDAFPVAGTPDADIAGLNALKQKYMHSPVIESTVTKQKTGGSEEVVQASVTRYRVSITGDVLPHALHVLETTSPLSDYLHAYNNDGTFTFDNRCKFNQQIDLYDEEGHVLESHDRTNIPTSLIWGYQGLHPVASVYNASNYEIGYTSFESEQKGFWSYPDMGVISGNNALAKTGGRFFLLSGRTLTRANLAPGEYILSYWGKPAVSIPANVLEDPSVILDEDIVTPLAISISEQIAGDKDGNGWVYYERRVTVNTSTDLVLSGAGLIDELRLYPADAQMKTFTHIPLVGLRDICDENNKVIKYEYDGLQRLKAIRDDDGHLLQQFTYEYNNISR